MKAAKLTEHPSFRLMRQTDVQNVWHMQMPRWLFSDPRYADMSLDTKVTYTFLLNRFQLSRRNGWVNDAGEVFVIFPRKALAKELRICEQRVTAAFRKLAELQLIWEKRCGRGDANQIYLASVTPIDDPSYECAPFCSESYESCGSRTADSAFLEAEEPQDTRPQNREIPAFRTADSDAPEPQNSGASNTDFSQPDADKRVSKCQQQRLWETVMPCAQRGCSPKACQMPTRGEAEQEVLHRIDIKHGTVFRDQAKRVCQVIQRLRHKSGNEAFRHGRAVIQAEAVKAERV